MMTTVVIGYGEDRSGMENTPPLYGPIRTQSTPTTHTHSHTHTVTHTVGLRATSAGLPVEMDFVKIPLGGG